MGQLPPRLVEIVQDVVNEKIRKEGGREPDIDSTRLPPPPRLSQRALAAAQGQEVGPVLGVQHRLSAAKQARENARLLEKHFMAYSARWQKDATRNPAMWQRNHPASAEWWHQKQQVDQAWDEAERLSQASGHPYKNRRGETVNARPDMSIVNLALRRYEQEILMASP